MVGPVNKLAHPQPDCDEVEKAEIAVGGLIVPGGETTCIFEFVEAPFDHVAQGISANGLPMAMRRGGQAFAIPRAGNDWQAS